MSIQFWTLDCSHIPPCHEPKTFPRIALSSKKRMHFLPDESQSSPIQCNNPLRPLQLLSLRRHFKVLPLPKPEPSPSTAPLHIRDGILALVKQVRRHKHVQHAQMLEGKKQPMDPIRQPQ